MPDLIGLTAYASFFLVTALVNAIVCLGLNVQWGQTGLFNVGDGVAARAGDGLAVESRASIAIAATTDKTEFLLFDLP